MSRTYTVKRLKMDNRNAVFQAMCDEALPGWVDKTMRGTPYLHGRYHDRWDEMAMIRQHDKPRKRMKEIIREERIWLTGECQWIWFWENDSKTERDAITEMSRLERESDWNMAWLRNVRETFYGVL